ncbi:MAG TPA: carboxypeptidase-like regulatory domain-containing protein, partial [Verrucomicrobiae bacterium]|nr:carboxypeptidase-like regulatory domain-containing protein [Verrucomicrobiae bacterium]
LSAQIRSGDEDQILAAFQEAIRVFVGADDPLVTGDQLNFRPSTWGYTKANLNFDGASVNADIRYIPQGSVSGQVQNSQGVPIGARVRLTGLGPDATGAPVVTIRGEANSDPATGAFSFPNQLLAGPWGLQVASPFYPSVLVTNGYTTEIDPDVTNVVLRFPPIQDVNGRIAGRVYNPDGTLAADGVRVHINISDDYQILTDTNGFFDTQTAFPALGRGYTVEAFDPVSGLKGIAGISMTPGITNIVDVHLLSRESTVQVVVLRADLKAAAGAQIELDQGSYPKDEPLFGTADTNGVVTFFGLWEGNYAASAEYTEASTKLTSRGGTSVGPAGIASIVLHLGGTGSIQGTFMAQDLTTPIYGAEVAIGNLGFATTDTNGFFNFDGVPLGQYQIISSDPVTGGTAALTTSLAYEGQVQKVRLVEQTLGVVSGFVLDSYGSRFVPGSKVQIRFSDGLTPSRTVTTGPNGGFSFPGSPLGAFSLSASYSVPGTLNLVVDGRASGVLSAAATNSSTTIQLQPLSYLTVRVLRPDGVTPAANARVTVAGASGAQQDT